MLPLDHDQIANNLRKNLIKIVGEALDKNLKRSIVNNEKPDSLLCIWDIAFEALQKQPYALYSTKYIKEAEWAIHVKNGPIKVEFERKLLNIWALNGLCITAHMRQPINTLGVSIYVQRWHGVNVSTNIFHKRDFWKNFKTRKQELLSCFK